MLAPAAAARKKKVLVVDDETDFALLRKVMPEYEIRVETQPIEALKVARVFRPHIVLMDIVMPEMHGLALAKRIRNERSLKNVPILLVSALVHSSEDTDDPVLIGEYPAFGKPFRIEALKRCIDLQIQGDDEFLNRLRPVKIGTLAGW